MPATIPLTVETMLSRSHRDPQTGCWEWMSTLNQSGYGKVTYRYKQMLAHRAMYGLVRGPIPNGLGLDHLCRNTRCINPDHLEAVTQKENVMRGNSFMAARSRQTHCVHGHPLDSINTQVRSNGRRRCLACRKRDNDSRDRRTKS